MSNGHPMNSSDSGSGSPNQQRAAWLSVLFMGLGQFYNRQWMKGIVFFAAGCGFWYLLLFQFMDQVKGIVSLGTQPSAKKNVDGIVQFVPGDNSTLLLINGLMFLVLFSAFLLIYYFNIRDARADGRLRDQGLPLAAFRATLKNLYNSRFPVLVLLIPAVVMLLLNVLPVLFNVLIAFTNLGVKRPPMELLDWTIDTFKELGTNTLLYRGILSVAAWTLIFAFLATFTCYFGGILLAVLIEMKEIRYKVFWRMMIIIPFAIPQLVRALVMKNILNTQFGPLNLMLGKLGIPNIPWLSEGNWARFSVILVNMWGGLATSMILAIGIMATINHEMYEAAEVDGAGSTQKFIKITLPILSVATTPYIILAFANNLSNFNAIYLLTNGGPLNVKYGVGYTDILVTWLYQSISTQPSLAAVVAIIMFLLIAGSSIYSYRRSASYREEDIKP